jgi:subtilisin family serine protease
VHTNPLGSGNFTGDCVAGNPGFDPANVCNNKLIGGYDFIWDLLDEDQNGIEDDPDTDDDPTFEDGDGHGSHTASTAGGNQVAAASFGGVEISGVARHANVIAFDVCFTEISTGRGLCASDASVASVDAAIADGLVDVINYSISGAPCLGMTRSRWHSCRQSMQASSCLPLPATRVRARPLWAMSSPGP